MNVVDLRAGEIVEGEVVEPHLSADDARTLTDEIRQTLRVGHGLIIRAFKGRAWTALGYKTWDDYCAGEFNEARMVRLDRDQRREIVAEMHEAGMSTRAIANGLGVSQFPVREDIAALRGTSQYSEPERVTSTDGRSMPARRDAAAPDAPRATPRRALPDQFFDAAYDLTKVTERIDRLVADDRFPQNAEKVGAKHRVDLLRAVELLTRALDNFPTN